MDLRRTEKMIWRFIWKATDSAEHDWTHGLDRDSIRNSFIDMGWMKTKAQEKRFEIAIERVRAKVWKQT